MTYKEKLIYLAGIIDGEGCVKVGKDKYVRPRCEVSNTSKELIDWLYENFDGHTSPVVKEGNRKLQYRWTLRKNEIKEILPQIIPYLIIKKEEAEQSLKSAQRIADYPKERICLRCQKRYISRTPIQKYCGSAKRKDGCSYVVTLIAAMRRYYKFKNNY